MGSKEALGRVAGIAVYRERACGSSRDVRVFEVKGAYRA